MCLQTITKSIYFSDIMVVKGSLDVNLRTGCLDEPVCNFIKNHILHELSLNLEGSILTTSYMFTAALEGVSIPFGDTWGMSQLMLTIAGTSEKDSGITLAGTIIHAETKRIGKCKYTLMFEKSHNFICFSSQ